MQNLLHTLGALQVGHQTLLERAKQWKCEDADASWRMSAARITYRRGKNEVGPIFHQIFDTIIKALLNEEMLLIGTTDGIMGWSHSRARPGDKIFLIPGSSVPVILREISEGQFKLVGDAWVHGVMNAEALAGVKEEDWGQLAIR